MMNLTRYYTLVAVVLFAGCSAIPEPERITIGQPASTPSWPLADFAVTFSSENGWESSGVWTSTGEDRDQSWTVTGGSQKTRMSGRQLELYTEFKLNENASLVVTLPGGGKLTLTSDDLNGSLNDQKPETSSWRLPAIWQSLHLLYQVGENSSDAGRILLAELNGVTIWENVTPEKTGDRGWIALVANGTVSLRHTGLRLTSPVAEGPASPAASPLILNSPVSYQYVEREEFTLLNQFGSATQAGSGEATIMDISAHAQRASNYGLVYSGSFEVEQAFDYEFLLTSDDGSDMSIDGQLLVSNDSSHGMVTRKGRILLEPGTHSFEVRFFQGGGGAGLRVDYQAEGLTERPFYCLEKGAPPSPESDPLFLDPSEEPVLQRGFITFPPGQPEGGDTDPIRRTHTVSVGSPDGLHFTLDAGQGSLLMFWKGSFASGMNMWQGRGEYQNLIPLGTLTTRDGKPDFSTINPQADVWPDSLATDSVFLTKGYSLDEQGWPTFSYQVGETLVQDAFTTDANAVKRTVTTEGGDLELSFRIASGTSIDYLEDGHYAVQGPGYMVDIQAAKRTQLFIRATRNGEELVAVLQPGGGSISTSIRW